MKYNFKKLPKKFKAKWLTALRGGEYRQGECELVDDDDNYCCLGVGCSVLGIENDAILNGGVPLDSMSSKIPSYFSNNHNHNDDWMERLTGMNDGTGGYKQKSFKQIANWIEKNL